MENVQPSDHNEVQNEPSNPIEIQNEPSNPIVVQKEPSNPIEIQNEPSDPIVVQNEPSSPIEIQNEPSSPIEIQNEPSNPIETLSESLDNSEVPSDLPEPIVVLNGSSDPHENLNETPDHIEVQDDPSIEQNLFTESSDRGSANMPSQMPDNNSIVLQSIPSTIAVNTGDIPPPTPGIIGTYPSMSVKGNENVDHDMNTEVSLSNQNSMPVETIKTSENGNLNPQDDVESSQSVLILPDSTRVSTEAEKIVQVEAEKETTNEKHDEEHTQKHDEEHTQKHDEEQAQKHDEEHTQKHDEEHTQKHDEEHTQKHDEEQTQKHEEHKETTEEKQEENETVEKIPVLSQSMDQSKASTIIYHRNTPKKEEIRINKPPSRRPIRPRTTRYPNQAIRNTFPNPGVTAGPANNATNPPIVHNPHSETPNPHSVTPNPPAVPNPHSETPNIQSETPNLPVSPNPQSETPNIQSETPNLPVSPNPPIVPNIQSETPNPPAVHNPPEFLSPPEVPTPESKTPDLVFLSGSENESPGFPSPPPVPSLQNDDLNPPAVAIQAPEGEKTPSGVLINPSISGHEANDPNLEKKNIGDSQVSIASSVFVMSPFQSDFSNDSPRNSPRTEQFPEIHPQPIPLINTEEQTQPLPQENPEIQTQTTPQQASKAQTQPTPQQKPEVKPIRPIDPSIAAPLSPEMNHEEEVSLLQNSIFTRSFVNEQINTYLSVVKSKTVGCIALYFKRSSAQSTVDRAQTPNC